MVGTGAPATGAVVSPRVIAETVRGKTSKSWIFSHSQATLDSIHTHPLATEIIATNPQGGVKAPDAGLRVLGAPLGHPDWCKQWLSDFVAELQPLLDAIAELAAHDHKGATQAAFLIFHPTRCRTWLRSATAPICAAWACRARARH